MSHESWGDRLSQSSVSFPSSPRPVLAVQTTLQVNHCGNLPYICNCYQDWMWRALHTECSVTEIDSFLQELFSVQLCHQQQTAHQNQWHPSVIEQMLPLPSVVTYSSCSSQSLAQPLIQNALSTPPVIKPSIHTWLESFEFCHAKFSLPCPLVDAQYHGPCVQIQSTDTPSWWPWRTHTTQMLQKTLSFSNTQRESP